MMWDPCGGVARMAVGVSCDDLPKVLIIIIIKLLKRQILMTNPALEAQMTAADTSVANCITIFSRTGGAFVLLPLVFSPLLKTM